MTDPVFSRALEALQQYFGYKSFRPAQELIVKSLLAGKETVAIMPTRTPWPSTAPASTWR